MIGVFLCGWSLHETSATKTVWAPNPLAVVIITDHLIMLLLVVVVIVGGHLGLGLGISQGLGIGQCFGCCAFDHELHDLAAVLLKEEVVVFDPKEGMNNNSPKIKHLHIHNLFLTTDISMSKALSLMSSYDIVCNSILGIDSS